MNSLFGSAFLTFAFFAVFAMSGGAVIGQGVQGLRGGVQGSVQRILFGAVFLGVPIAMAGIAVDSKIVAGLLAVAVVGGVWSAVIMPYLRTTYLSVDFNSLGGGVLFTAVGIGIFVSAFGADISGNTTAMAIIGGIFALTGGGLLIRILRDMISGGDSA